MGYIYKIQNKVDNKIYIGKTVNTVQERWAEHVDEASRGDNTYLHKAIQKYGAAAFYVDTIEECICEQLNEREQYYIALFHSHISEGGYNMTFGGEGAIKYSDESILNLWTAGLRACEIAERLGASPNTISQRLKNLIEDKSAIQRYAESRQKAVIQYSIDGDPIRIWDSASHAEVSLNISRGQISKCCNKLSVIAGGYLWKFTTDETPIIDLQIRYAESNKCCFVNQIDDDGNIIRTFESGKEAELTLDLPRGKVSEVCNGKRKHTKKYKFEWGYPIKRRLINERLQ